jgi:predicted nucleic acid-binding protein
VIVFDASIAVKWFLDEAGSPEAKDLLTQYIRKIIVPDIFLVEVVSTLVRQANIDKSVHASSKLCIARFSHMFEMESLRAVPIHLNQIERASNLAINLGHPLKDCIYLVLAMEFGCELVTADARFAAKAKGVWDRVRVLGVVDN